MKILFVSAYDATNVDAGAPQRVHNLVKGLSRKHDVTVVCYSNRKNKRMVGDAMAYTTKYFSRRHSKVIPVGLLVLGFNVMRRKEFDLVFGSHLFGGLPALILSLLYRKPFVYDAHNVEYKLFWDIGWYHMMAYAYVVERLCCYFSKLVCMVSEVDHEIVGGWVKHDSVVVPNGVDLNVFTPKEKEDGKRSPTILFFGNMDYPPNREAVQLIGDVIIESTIQKVGDVKFRVVGKNNEIGVFRPPSHPNLECAGFVEDIAGEINNADMVVVPLLKGSGTRYKILESLACGVPVVSTPKGAEGLSPGLKGLVLCEPEGFPENIRRMLNSKRDRVQDESIREYSWDRILGEFDVKLSDTFRQ